MPKLHERKPANPKSAPVKPCHRIELFRRYRTARNLTYAALGAQVNINPSTLRRKLSKNGIDGITAQDAFSLIAVLQIPLEEAADAWRRDGK